VSKTGVYNHEEQGTGEGMYECNQTANPERGTLIIQEITIDNPLTKKAELCGYRVSVYDQILEGDGSLHRVLPLADKLLQEGNFLLWENDLRLDYITTELNSIGYGTLTGKDLDTLIGANPVIPKLEILKRLLESTFPNIIEGIDGRLTVKDLINRINKVLLSYSAK